MCVIMLFANGEFLSRAKVLKRGRAAFARQITP